MLEAVREYCRQHNIDFDSYKGEAEVLANVYGDDGVPKNAIVELQHYIKSNLFSGGVSYGNRWL